MELSEETEITTSFLKMMQGDNGIAWAWHSNIAVPLMDETACDHETANWLAAKLMVHLFEVDMTKHPLYRYPEHGSRLTPINGDMAEALYGTTPADGGE